MNHQSHYVYLVNLIDSDKNLLKIGFTGNLSLRAVALKRQTFAQGCEILYSIKLLNEQAARRREKEVLNKFREFMISPRREFFTYNPYLICQFSQLDGAKAWKK